MRYLCQKLIIDSVCNQNAQKNIMADCNTFDCRTALVAKILTQNGKLMPHCLHCLDVRSASEQEHCPWSGQSGVRGAALLMMSHSRDHQQLSIFSY